MPRARYVRARARQQLKDFAAAIDDLQAFLKSNPPAADKSDARYLLGLCQSSLNKPAEAVKTLRELLADDPHYGAADKVLYELAWAQKADGHEADAAETFARLAKSQPDSPLVAESLYHVGEHYYQQHDYKQASKAFYESMQKAGKSELGQTAAYKLGWAYYRARGLRQCAADIRLLAWNISDERVEFRRGVHGRRVAAQAGEVQRRHRCICSGQEAETGRLVGVGAVACRPGSGAIQQWQPALELLDAAHKADTKEQYSPEILYEQGWAKQNLGRQDEALELYEDVTRRSDGEVAARARFMIGEIYFEKKSHSEAIRNFFKVAYGYAFPEWQAASQYEAGRCFEVLGKVGPGPPVVPGSRAEVSAVEQGRPAKERLAAPR